MHPKSDPQRPAEKNKSRRVLLLPLKKGDQQQKLILLVKEGPRMNVIIY